MKKLVVTLLTILTCGAVQALPVRNPGEASLFTNGIYCESNGCSDFCDPCFSWCDAWSIRIGFDGNYVYNRHLEIGDDDAREGTDIKRTEIYTSAGYLAFNLCNRFDVFGTLGSTTIGLGFDQRVLFPNLGTFAQWDVLAFEPTFSWSVGGRATLWECDCFTVGLEGEYFRTRPKFDYLITDVANTNNRIYSLNDDHRTTYSEWQVGLGASYTIATSCPSLAFVPYLAVTWSGASFQAHNFNVAVVGTAFSFPKCQPDKLWGFVVGTSFTLCDVAGVTVEGRFGDQKAIAVNGQFRF